MRSPHAIIFYQENTIIEKFEWNSVEMRSERTRQWWLWMGSVHIRLFSQVVFTNLIKLTQ